MSALKSWELPDAVVSLESPAVVGILNVTPDSFSDGERWLEPTAAVDRALRMVDEGADLVDVGAESTRPGAPSVDEEEEWRRLEPVVTGLAPHGVRLSIDTTKYEIARRALDSGVAAVNDVSGLRFSPEIASLCAAHGAGLILMHMRGVPRTMQMNVEYRDLLGEVRQFLETQASAALSAGCSRGQIVIDPGIGFGKSAEGSLELLSRIAELTPLGYPVLVGPSRKSFIGRILGLSIEQRLEATIAACLAAYQGGARLFRVHDVAPVRRALDMAEAIQRVAGERAPDRTAAR
ncbi:MAG: dihydropteroate synthase [Gemmatimonadota bacterium]